jgi:hypothetical protein
MLVGGALGGGMRDTFENIFHGRWYMHDNKLLLEYAYIGINITRSIEF